LEGEDLDVHDVVNDSRDLIHCNVTLPISGLLIIGPPTSAFLITAPHEVLPKSRFLKVDEKELNNVNKVGHRAKKHTKVWVKKTFDEW